MAQTMRPQIGAALLALFVAAAIGVPTLGCNTERQGNVPPLERRAQEINKAIMCPVCPGESIDQSQNALAKQMRAVVVEKLQEGWEEEQIKAFFVERYGPRVLMAPPREGFNILAWALPPLVVVIAVAALHTVLRRMRKPPAFAFEEEPAPTGAAMTHRTDYVQRIERVLGLDAIGEERDDGLSHQRRQEGEADG